MSILFIFGLAYACYTDWKYRKISNSLVFSLALLGVLFQATYHGMDGVVFSAFGWIVGLALLFVPFCMGGIGGGDVKLLAALGAFFGPHAILLIFLASAVLGGLFSIATMVHHQNFWEVSRGIKHRLVYLAMTHRLPKESEIKFSKDPIRIPYSFAIVGGFFAVLAMGGI